MTRFTESIVEEAALDWLRGLSYAIIDGATIAFGEPAAERKDPALRDALLPKLISGEIRVKDAEKMFEAIA